MVKKLEKVSNVTTSTLQQGQVKKRKIRAKECCVQIKGPNMGHNSAMCPIEIKNKTKLARRQRYLAKTRACYICKEKGHMIAACPKTQSESDSDQTGQTTPLQEQARVKINDEAYCKASSRCKVQ
jgi:hypothetical protein